MAEETDTIVRQTLGALFLPLARMLIEHGVTLPEAVDLLKSALLAAARDEAPDASASQISLMTGVHRKDIRRLADPGTPPDRISAAARVLTLWQTEADYREDQGPKALQRDGSYGFDALVKRAKVDAAPATVLSLLLSSGNAREEDGLIHFVSAALVPDGQVDRLRAARSTLVPHLETVASNLAGKQSQWDQALRYSHLSQEAARSLEEEAAELALQMLQRLNARARTLQEENSGQTLFVAGTFTNLSEQD